MIGTVLNLGSFLLSFASKIYPDSKDITGAATVADRAKLSYNVINTTSVQQSASRAIIAPMVAIEQSLLHQEFMPDLMGIVNLRDVVATLTHLALQNSVGMGVKVDSLIGTINPNRGGMLSIMGAEAYDNNIKPKAAGKDTPEKEEEKRTNVVVVGGKTFPDLTEFTPLAVGKVVTATLYGDNGTPLEFPLTFRQTPMPITNKDLKTVFGAAKGEDGFFARILMLKTAEITGPEFLTGKDIIKKEFNISNDDLSGYYKEAKARETGNRVAAIRTGLVSFNTMANTFIFTSSTAAQLELEMGRRFADKTSRAEIFKAVKANTIVVCNEDRGLYTFYTHGSAMAEVYTRKDLASKSKKDGGSNTLADLVKLLNGGM